jgi:hypothetical protein
MERTVVISEHSYDAPPIDGVWNTKSLHTIRDEKPQYTCWRTEAGFMFCEKARPLCGRLVIGPDGVERFIPQSALPPRKIIKVITFI